MHSAEMEKHDRLKEARKAAGFSSASKAAESLNVPVPTYLGHENGSRDFDQTAAQQYARRFGVRAAWLIIGEEPRKGRAPAPVDDAQREEPKRVPVGQEFDPDPEFDDGSRHPIDSDDLSKLGVSTLRPFSGEVPGSSPDIDTSAGAGPGGLPAPSVLPTGEVVYSADAVRGEILMPDYLLSEFTRAKAPRVHWIKVRGDSMEPTLLPGERVMVDTTDQQFGQGGVFVIRDPDGEILVKRLRKLKDGEIELVSDNPKQPPMVHRADEIGILGRVVGRLARM